MSNQGRSRGKRGGNLPRILGASALPAPLAEALEAQRRRLGRIESLLGCLSSALQDSACLESCEVSFASVVDIAREQLGDVVDRLDIVELDRAMKASAGPAV